MAPTIAVTIAPATPPPTACPASAAISTSPPAAPCSIGRSAVRSVPPPAPPSAPAMVLPSAPRSRFFMVAPAAFPPIAPAMSWMMRLTRVDDMMLPPWLLNAVTSLLPSVFVLVVRTPPLPPASPRALLRRCLVHRLHQRIDHLVDAEARGALARRIFLEGLQERGYPPHAVL